MHVRNMQYAMCNVNVQTPASHASRHRVKGSFTSHQFHPHFLRMSASAQAAESAAATAQGPSTTT